MGRPSGLDPLADLVTGAEDEDPTALRFTDSRLEALALWESDPWAFLTGKDPDTGEPIIRTQDERDISAPIKPFPAHLKYLHYLVDLLQNEPKLLIEKSSQMIVTTTVLLHSAWDFAFHPHTGMLSKHKEAEAEALIRTKVRVPWRLMPEWLKLAIPITPRPANRANWSCQWKRGTQPMGQLWGLTENAAAAEARGNTYTRGLIDEAEFQDMLEELITAMLPRTEQLVVWSTPNTGGPGAATFRKYAA